MHRGHCSIIALPALALVVLSANVSAQRAAAAELVAPVPAVLKLETVRTGGTPERAGTYTEVRQAVVLRVRANCPWRLVAEAGADVVQVRVNAAGGAEPAESGYTQVAHGRRELAKGGPSSSADIVLDYRLKPGAGIAPLSYELQALE